MACDAVIAVSLSGRIVRSIRGRTSSAPAWIVDRLLRVGADLAKPADRDIDDVGPDRAHRRLIDAEPLDDAGTEVLHKGVGLFAQFEQRAAARGGLEVERDRALVAIVVEKR